MRFFSLSRGNFEAFVFGFCLVLASLLCLSTYGNDLDVAAIAGRPASAVNDVPQLDVSAIAANPCECDEPLDLVAMSPKRRARRGSPDPAETPDRRSPPGSNVKPDESAASSRATSPPGQRSSSSKTTVSDRTTPPATMMATTKPPRYEWRPVCNGRFCQYQWVLVQ